MSDLLDVEKEVAKLIEIEKEGFKKLNLSYEDLLHHAATAVVYLKIQDYEMNELIAKSYNNAIQIINESSLLEKEKELITGRIFEQLRIDIEEIRTDRNREIASYGGKGKVAKDSDGKQEAKATVREEWLKWQKNPSLYKTKTSFAEAMIVEYPVLTSPKVIMDWCRTWESECQPA